MVRVEEATSIILSNLFKPTTHRVKLQDAVGRVLAETVRADRDFPPFDRVAMDGIAIHSPAWANGRRTFGIEGVQAAGKERQQLRDIDNAVEVMTGAMLPEGTDTVIRYEDVTISGSQATIHAANVEGGQNIHRQASDAKANSVLLEPGIRLSPAEIALLASVGKAEIDVYAFPKTAIISTGDEIVSIAEAPLPHQIRRSNTYALEAAMQRMGWEGTQFHMPDRKDFLQESLPVITAAHDVMILSGGISKGKFDYIPEVLEWIGIRKLIQHVSQRPGKPFWFGVMDSGKYVFALPGNPVSTYLCFYRYVAPWMWASLGAAVSPQYAVLAADFTFQPEVTYFLQVRVQNEHGRLMAYPAAGGGSGDFANLKLVDGFLELPAGKSRFAAGEVFPYLPFR